MDYIDDITQGPDEELKALTRSLLQEMKELSQDNPLFTEEMRLNMVNIDNPGKIADFIASILNVDRLKQQKILETFNVRNRIEQVLVFMKNEQHLIRIQKKVATEINERIEKNQREYFLREELKEIKRELGEPSDARSSEYQKYKEMIDKLDFEGEVKEQVETELEKFAIMEPQSSEYIVTRNYLDTIVNLPWEDPEPDSVDLAKGEKILNRDHYGLEDVKERILEYLAVRKLKNDTKGSIVLLVGPPGVGKDIHRKIHRRYAEQEILPLLRGRHERRGGNQGPPAHLYRFHARKDHSGTENRQNQGPRLHDRRD